MQESSQNCPSASFAPATTPPTTRTVRRLQPFGETTFATMSGLANELGAINLGQGYPDWDGPKAVLDAAKNAIDTGNNQYAPGRGLQVLRDAIVADRARRIGQLYDANTECLVTVGATEAITATVLGLVEPGAHVVVIEPYYDAYVAAIALADANYATVPLTPSAVAPGAEITDSAAKAHDGHAEDSTHAVNATDSACHTWSLDRAAFSAAVRDDTSLIIINSPHNPTGSVLTAEDLALVASEAIAHDCIVLSDEVYERLHFDGAEHISIASLPGMRERTVVVSSAAKTFNVTGWKTGWALAPAPLLDAVVQAKQFLTYVGVTPVQPAVAVGLNDCEDWVAELRDSLQANRDLLAHGLEELGATVYDSAAGYFIVADISGWGYGEGAQACVELARTAGVVTIPVSAFTDGQQRYRNLVRFAFCKKREVLVQALRHLGQAVPH